MLDKAMGVFYPKTPRKVWQCRSPRNAVAPHKPRIGPNRINPNELERQQWRSPRRFPPAQRSRRIPKSPRYPTAISLDWNTSSGDAVLNTERVTGELRSYAYACIDAVYQNLTKMGLPVLTIGMVQGEALGGGFEHVLTNDVIIAERDSRMGLPEVLFNLFPGMGAYSLLCRRLDGVRAQKLILSGRLYEAAELEELGLVDLVVDQGEGPAAVREYLERNRRRHDTLLALSRVRQRCQPITYEELIDVTEVWVETAMGLHEADLRRMEHLVRAQLRRHARTRPAPAASLSAVG